MSYLYLLDHVKNILISYEIFTFYKLNLKHYTLKTFTYTNIHLLTYVGTNNFTLCDLTYKTNYITPKTFSDDREENLQQGKTEDQCDVIISN